MVEAYLEQIKAHPAFEGIDQDEDILWLRKCMDAQIKIYPAGETLFKEGEELIFSSIVLSGRVLAVSGDGSIREIGPGGYLFEDMPAGRSFYAPFTALADEEVTVFSMKVLRLAKLCSFRCAFHARLLDNLAAEFVKE